MPATRYPLKKIAILVMIYKAPRRFRDLHKDDRLQLERIDRKSGELH
jgi:hypothetical protein